MTLKYGFEHLIRNENMFIDNCHKKNGILLSGYQLLIHIICITDLIVSILIQMNVSTYLYATTYYNTVHNKAYSCYLYIRSYILTSLQKYLQCQMNLVAELTNATGPVFSRALYKIFSSYQVNSASCELEILTFNHFLHLQFFIVSHYIDALKSTETARQNHSPQLFPGLSILQTEV